MADALAHYSSGESSIEWLSSLDTEFQPKRNYRRTSIICTIGASGFAVGIGTADPGVQGRKPIRQRRSTCYEKVGGKLDN